MYLLQKLSNLNVNPSVLQMFYRAFIESVLTFSFLGWFGSLSVKNKTALARVVNVCSKIVGERQASLNELYESHAVRKGRKIAGDSADVLARHYELFPLGRRYRMPRTRTLRAKNSFVPRSIVLCNLRI